MLMWDMVITYHVYVYSNIYHNYIDLCLYPPLLYFLNPPFEGLVYDIISKTHTRIKGRFSCFKGRFLFLGSKHEIQRLNPCRGCFSLFATVIIQLKSCFCAGQGNS